MYIVDLSGIIEPWKEIGTILKAELRRTLLNISTALVLRFKSLTSQEYAQVMKRHKKKVEEIENEVDRVLDRVPFDVSASLFIVNPALGVANITRNALGKFDVDTVEEVFEEYNIMDISVLGLPIGKGLHTIIQKSLNVGGFVTFNQKLIQKTDKELDKDAETKWWTPIERIFLLKSPFSSSKTEGRINHSGKLLFENKTTEEEYENFKNILHTSGFTERFMKTISIPYVEAKEEIAEILISSLEETLEDAANIAAAENLNEFLSSLSQAKSNSFKQINVQQLKKEISENVKEIKDNKELTRKLLGNSKVTDEAILDILYKKEFTKVRQKLINSINQIIENIKEELIGTIKGTEELKQLKGNPIGDRLVLNIQYSIESIKKATEVLKDIEGKAK